jgi:hypothetical protein
MQTRSCSKKKKLVSLMDQVGKNLKQKNLIYSSIMTKDTNLSSHKRKKHKIIDINLLKILESKCNKSS